MTRRRLLKDGEVRRIKPGKFWAAPNIDVDAYRVDCDTPYVILTINGQATRLEDCCAAELIDRMQRALSVLPTSK